VNTRGSEERYSGYLTASKARWTKNSRLGIVGWRRGFLHQGFRSPEVARRPGALRAGGELLFKNGGGEFSVGLSPSVPVGGAG